jgi:hypothetical protein
MCVFGVCSSIVANPLSDGSIQGFSTSEESSMGTDLLALRRGQFPVLAYE